ncbi:hypothetical protein TWF481_012232 [Arthrobotrys musiformis]|uniref:F-box domain-containing protein n=1 Tax=Arthrobotrys musiformis TaxID=47236 RepID=A0AAV9VYV5_9PEZI
MTANINLAVGADPPAVSVTTLPTELTFLILSFLSPKDYKKFSSISKTCRNACIPFIFRHIRLFPENIPLWKNNPQICLAVRRVSLYTLQHGRDNVAQLLDFWRVCTNAVGLFPHITGIKLLYLSTSFYLQRKDLSERDSLDVKHLQLDNRIFSAIFSTLSTFPFYYTTLKRIHIEMDRFGAIDEIALLEISDENQYFLDSTDRVMAGAGLDHTPFPRGVEEATLTSREVHFTLPGYNMHSFTSLQYCQDSLSSFSILGTPADPVAQRTRLRDAYIENPVVGPKVPEYTYPNVTTLCVSSSFMVNEYFYELPARFPNVTELRVHDHSARLGLVLTGQLEEVTSMLREFKKLKGVILPWPLKEVDDFDWERPGWDPVPPVPVEEIEAIVTSWLQDLELKYLDKMAFWSWNGTGKDTRCDAVIFTAARSWREEKGSKGLGIKRVNCGTREEMFPILGKGWKPVCWIDYSKQMAREGLVIGAY